ncbi:hypothetical protein BV898_19635 [Hypsibius exemplaris]|uniref:Uncharacterized protein n=1 Tax=Hypsibius exemplaris TaxID=2072580 RepID=A0A9X6NK15_HYPEX|nr:hypothetical protein BV898_19635 [Hypsibius exemplaris]
MASIVYWYSDPVPKVSVVSNSSLRIDPGVTVREKMKCDAKWKGLYYPCLIVQLDNERTKLELDKLLFGNEQDYKTLGELYPRNHQGSVDQLGPSEIAVGDLAPTASVTAVSSEVTFALPGSGVAPHHASPNGNPSSSQPAQQLYFHAPHYDQAGPSPHPASVGTTYQGMAAPPTYSPPPIFSGYGGHAAPHDYHHGYMPQPMAHYPPQPQYHSPYEQQSETLEYEKRIGGYEKLLNDVQKELKELRDKLQNGDFQSAHSKRISKDPVLVKMLLKHTVSVAIREGMRGLFSKEEMLSSVLKEKNIKHSKLCTRVLNDAKLSTLLKSRANTETNAGDISMNSSSTSYINDSFIQDE